MWKSVTGLRRVEWIAVVATFIIVAIVLLYPARWASDGDILLPIRIFVYDAVHGHPIANAACLVFRSPPVFDASALHEHFLSDGPISDWPASQRGTSDETGKVEISYKFGTSASHLHPSPRAHLANASVRVEAAGFGGVVVPVRYAESPVSDLRDNGPVRISIGLIPVN